jgi:hypothetical protein
MALKHFVPSLKAELTKAAKLGNIQSTLGGPLKSLPVIAIAAGSVAAKAMGGSNVIEERILGRDETFLLGSPTDTMKATKDNWMLVSGNSGPAVMCMTCGKGQPWNLAYGTNKSSVLNQKLHIQSSSPSFPSSNSNVSFSATRL